jgi:hypothetical protein
MASRCGLRLVSFEALVAILFLVATVSASATAGFSDRPSPGPPLVLPLTRSYRNASRFAASLRRGLGGGTRPNARMRLHDDLLTNGSVQPDFFLCWSLRSQFLGRCVGSDAGRLAPVVLLVQVLHDEAVHRDAATGVRADR